MLDIIDIVAVTPNDLAGIYKEIAEQVGVEVAYKLFEYFRGQQIAFPLKFFSKEFIANQIALEYDGSNIRALARKYGYTEARIRQLIKGVGEKKGKVIHIS